MSVQVEALFTAALGLSQPWEVAKVDLDTAKQRIDFDVVCSAKRLACPSCGATDQPVHDRVRRQWRHMDIEPLRVHLCFSRSGAQQVMLMR